MNKTDLYNALQANSTDLVKLRRKIETMQGQLNVLYKHLDRMEHDTRNLQLQAKLLVELESKGIVE